MLSSCVLCIEILCTVLAILTPNSLLYFKYEYFSIARMEPKTIPPFSTTNFINHISILFTSSLLVNEYSSSLIRTTSSVQISLYRHFYGHPHWFELETGWLLFKGNIVPAEQCMLCNRRNSCIRHNRHRKYENSQLKTCFPFGLIYNADYCNSLQKKG